MKNCTIEKLLRFHFISLLFFVTILIRANQRSWKSWYVLRQYIHTFVSHRPFCKVLFDFSRQCYAICQFVIFQWLCKIAICEVHVFQFCKSIIGAQNEWWFFIIKKMMEKKYILKRERGVAHQNGFFLLFIGQGSIPTLLFALVDDVRSSFLFFLFTPDCILWYFTHWNFAQNALSIFIGRLYCACVRARPRFLIGPG